MALGVTPLIRKNSSTYLIKHGCSVCNLDKSTEYAKFAKGRHLQHRACKDERTRLKTIAFYASLTELNCSGCKVLKSVNEFNKNRSRPGYDLRCRTCKAATHREAHLRRRFGMTLEEYDALLKKQDNACAICKKQHAQHRPGTNLPIDHCHTTGKVRGLLCDFCNQGIGSLMDSPELLRAAADYLEKHK